MVVPLGRRGQRMSRCLATCTTDEQADARAEVVREIARLLAASGNAADIPKWVAVACDGDDVKALAVLGYARKLAAGQVATKPTSSSSAGKTFADVAKMWTSGELTRLYPDHVTAKRTADLDVTRLDVLSKTVGNIPVDRFTVDDAERAMRSLPEGLRPATRRQYAQALRRVLELAAYPLRLIPSNPLPRLFLPKARNDLALQVLFPDEEAKLMACAAVPLAYRMTYGFLARVGFRKSEVIGDRETDAEPLRWRDFDLARGVVRVARSKSEKPRPVALEPDVCAALVAWKAKLGEPSEAAPVFAGVNLANAETFRGHLLAAGVDRAELHTSAADSLPIRIHDLRATFVTVSLATGKPDAWIRDRTSHKTISMLDRYRRAARTLEELNAGPLAPMLNAVAGLRVNGASTAATKARKETGQPRVTPKGSSAWIRTTISGIKRREVHFTPKGLGAYSPKKARIVAALRLPSPPPIDAPVDAMGVSSTNVAGAPPALAAGPAGASTSTPSDAPQAAPDDASARPPTTSGDVLEHALALAISEAAKAGQWAIVSQLGRELEARRLASLPNVVPFGAKRPSRR